MYDMNDQRSVKELTKKKSNEEARLSEGESGQQHLCIEMGISSTDQSGHSTTAPEGKQSGPIAPCFAVVPQAFVLFLLFHGPVYS